MKKSSKYSKFLFAAIAVISTVSLQATTFYVSTTGSDASTTPTNPATPVRTIQKGIDLANAAINSNQDAVVHVAAGSYRELVDFKGVSNNTRSITLEGEAGAVLTGADQWNAGWTQNADGTYVHSWPYTFGAQPIPDNWGTMEPGDDGYWNWDGLGYLRNRILRSEVVYINDKGLLGRLNLSELSTPGTFYVDEANDKIYIRPHSGTSMSTANIEVAVRQRMLAVNGRKNVTIKNLTIEKGRGSVQATGASMFDMNYVENVLLDGLNVRWGGSGGLSGIQYKNLTIRNSKFNDNGVHCLELSNGVNVLVEDCEIARNNWRGWDAMHLGFGTGNKFFMMSGLTVRRCMFIDNNCHGMWLDSDNKNVLVDNIYSARNKMRGFYNEINEGPVTIQNSKFCQNRGSGIGAASGSMNFNLINNQIFDNKTGQIEYTGSEFIITLVEWDTGKTNVLTTSNHNFQGNTIVGYGTPMYFNNTRKLDPDPEGWMIWGPGKVHIAGWLKSYKGDNNRYFHRNTTMAFAGWNKSGADSFTKFDFNGWRTTYCNDPLNVNKNNEANSTWGDPGPLDPSPQFQFGGGGSNAAPVINSITPSHTIYGDEAILNATASDDAGEASLTYTWSASGPAPVMTDDNATNSAKNTPAIFSKAGTYTITLTVTDAGGLTASSNLTVVVSQTLTTVSISPSSASVPVNTTRQFSAGAKDQFGAAMAATFSWTASGGGTVSSSGLFAAENVAGGPFNVTATTAGRSVSASVTVTSVTMNSLHVARIDMSFVAQTGGSVRAMARVYVVDQNGAPVPSATVSGTWSGIHNSSPTATTGTAGMAQFTTSKSKQYGTWTFTVTGLSKTGYTYNAAQNGETSDSISR